MKIKLFLFAFSIAILSSCTPNKEKNKQSVTPNDSIEIEFDSIQLKENIKLIPNSADSLPYAEIKINFVYPSKFRSEKELYELHKIFYSEILNLDSITISNPENAINLYISNYINYYRSNTSEYNEWLKDFGNEAASSYRFSFFSEISNKIEYENNHLIAVSNHWTDYSGGAHGNYGQICFNVDLNTIKKIELKDLFNKGYETKLTEIIKLKLIEYMLKNEWAKDETDAQEHFFDFNKIAPNDNFLITANGLRFVYNPYEIAAYAIGAFEIDIPYSEISEILNTDAINNYFTKP